MAVIVNFFKETPFSEEQLKRIKALGDLREVPQVPKGGFSEEEAARLISEADYAIVAPSAVPFLSRKILYAATHLKAIVLNTTNTSWVDKEAAKERGITIANILSYSTEAVAEFAIGLMFAVARNISRADRAVKAGERSFEDYCGMELKDKTLGIAGFGEIGKRTAELGQAIGMKVIAWNRTPKENPPVRFVAKDQLFREADILSLHLALSYETREFVGAAEIKTMKPGAILVNVSPEELVNQYAVLDALSKNHLAGYGFELDEGKGAPGRDEVLKHERTVATPHIGWFTPEAQRRSLEMMVARLEEIIRSTK
jgi:phosphoglycerate dehydrogenase-like enzyme